MGASLLGWELKLKSTFQQTILKCDNMFHFFIGIHPKKYDHQTGARPCNASEASKGPVLVGQTGVLARCKQLA